MFPSGFVKGGVPVASASGGSAALSSLTAATAANTLANGNNTGQVWNWATTTDATVAQALGETTAATGGTSTTGVPNQVLFKLSTLAASTQSALSVWSRGAHVFSVSPTAAQILATNGSASAAAYGFASQPGAGMYYDGTYLRLTAASFPKVTIGSSFIGLGAPLYAYTGFANAPGITEGGISTSGLYWPDSSTVAITSVGDESARFNTGIAQVSRAQADTVSYAINARKARGTVAAPTVITTGDKLLTQSGFGYVGATNTYVEAARITYSSTGVIADTTSGIGGVVSLSASKVGVVGPVEILQINGTEQHTLFRGTAPTISAGGGVTPSIVGRDQAFQITIGTGGTATSVTAAFANAFTNSPICVAQSDTDLITIKVAATTGSVVITGASAFTAGSKINVIALGFL